MQLLNIRALKISVYHPQIDGLVERFNGTLKAILRKFVNDDPWHWDKLLPALLFAVWEVPEGSTGFSPFKFLCRRQPRGIQDPLWETWEEQESHATGPFLISCNFRNTSRGSMDFLIRIYFRHSKFRSSSITGGPNYEPLSSGTGSYFYYHQPSPSYPPSGRGHLRLFKG